MGRNLPVSGTGIRICSLGLVDADVGVGIQCFAEKEGGGGTFGRSKGDEMGGESLGMKRKKRRERERKRKRKRKREKERKKKKKREKKREKKEKERKKKKRKKKKRERKEKEKEKEKERVAMGNLRWVDLN